VSETEKIQIIAELREISIVEASAFFEEGFECKRDYNPYSFGTIAAFLWLRGHELAEALGERPREFSPYLTLNMEKMQ